MTPPRHPARAGVLAGVLLLAVGIWIEWGDALLPWGGPEAAKGTAAAEEDRGRLPDGDGRFAAELPADRYAAVARALRRGDLDAGRRRLAALSDADRRALGPVPTLLGLAAFAAGDGKQAVELLSASPADGPFADWRLLVLAEQLAGRRGAEAALARYAHLASRFPDSPLRPDAVVAAARLHQHLGEPFQALDLVEVARREGWTDAARVDLEALAWELGGELNDDAVRREAARRLLVLAPWRAAALGVADPYRDGDGRLPWSELLTAAELGERARTFLSLAQPDAARLTLESVAAAERRLPWHLAMAEAHLALRHPRRALDVLEAAPAARAADLARVELLRGRASADLSQGRGGGSPDDEERRRLAAASRRHLETAAALADDDELAARALRRLWAGLAAQDRAGAAAGAEPSLDDWRRHRRPVLAALKRRDPADRSGAEALWRRGWQAYRADELESAAAWWRELADLYPRSRQAHRGRYWRARVLEATGQPRLARRLYDELVSTSDTTDFYRRRALVRLGAAPRLVGSRAERLREPRPWDVDPALARALFLSDVGLDPLAARELSRVADRADPDDALALDALLLARSGHGAAAAERLRRAFPALGGPSQGSVPTEILRAYYPLTYEAEIRRAARRSGVPAYLLAGIVRQESDFDPRAVSPVGARGLMQLMPPTAREVASHLGEPWSPQRLTDPAYSVLLGSVYFRHVLEMFDGNLELALAGYNGGPSRIRRLWHRQGPAADVDEFLETLQIGESRRYVERVLILADSYRQLYPEAGSVPLG